MKPAEKMHSGINDERAAPSEASAAAIDPVCGMSVDPQAGAGSYEYNGKTYYFCSTHCLHKFREDPELFLNKSNEPKASHPIRASVTAGLANEVEAVNQYAAVM